MAAAGSTTCPEQEATEDVTNINRFGVVLALMVLLAASLLALLVAEKPAQAAFPGDRQDRLCTRLRRLDYEPRWYGADQPH